MSTKRQDIKIVPLSKLYKRLPVGMEGARDSCGMSGTGETPQSEA
ncbi:hypothetical protein QY97_02537 [Bacillus thermotolerans]|uniref:Uncharacterized protein n=1 Tax=Bacillus thermotolerans TaxID=1221996 RepID=A0A0F5HVH3_BACTR|nr:hypothetical protein QY97_02537 [Bacillus thermotolerans]KKB36852.1 hypothetical protein QY95_02926 [Bacillus thermotolerans]